MPALGPFAGVLFVLVVIVLSGIRIAQEYQRAVVFRLGRFIGIKGPGIYYLIPLIDRQCNVYKLYTDELYSKYPSSQA